MEKQVQYFSIANLIFTSPANQEIMLNSKEIEEIQNRFITILKSFEESSETHYSSGFVMGKNSLPYNSMVTMGRIGNYLILHFTYSYKNPILFVIDTKEKLIKNYIDISLAKNILNDDVYEDITESLHYPKNMKNLFKGIENMDNFINSYQAKLSEHENKYTVTGYDCFEITL